VPIRGVARAASRGQERKGVSNDLVMLGGLVEEEHPTAVRPTDLLRARNCVRKGRTTGTRPGLTLTDADYNAAIAGTPGVQGIYEFRRNRDADRDLVTVADGVAYSDDSTALDKATNSVVISTGDDYHWTFATHADRMYAAGGNFGITAASPAYHAGEPSAVLLDVVGVPYDATAPSIGSREFVEVPAALGPFEPFASSLWERLDVLDLVRIAIGTDGSDDVGQGQGWWADSYSADEYRIGWRTELLRRGVTGEEERIRQGLLGGLRFLVTDGHADRVEVAVERVGEALAATVTVHRDEAAGGSVSLRYPDLWNMVRDGS